MKTLTLIAFILWQGFVPDLAMQKARIVQTDSEGIAVERLVLHKDALGDMVEIWEPAGATESAIYKAAVLEMANKKESILDKLLK